MLVLSDINASNLVVQLSRVPFFLVFPEWEKPFHEVHIQIEFHISLFPLQLLISDINASMKTEKPQCFHFFSV